MGKFRVFREGKPVEMDFDNPSPEMVKQLCGVAIRRLQKPMNADALKLLYLNNPGCPAPVTAIFKEYLEGKISSDEAIKRLQEYGDCKPEDLQNEQRLIIVPSHTTN